MFQSSPGSRLARPGSARPGPAATRPGLAAARRGQGFRNREPLKVPRDVKGCRGPQVYNNIVVLWWPRWGHLLMGRCHKYIYIYMYMNPFKTTVFWNAFNASSLPF